MSAWIKIARAEAGVGGQAAFEFNSINQSYTDLLLVISGRNEGGQEHLLISFNGSTSNFSNRFLTNSPPSSSTSSTYARYLGNQMPSGAPSNTFGNAYLYISNYSSSSNKNFFCDSSGYRADLSSIVTTITSGLWSITNPITSITIQAEATSDFAQYSSATLYGITKGSSGGVTVS